jgi:HlyD family secretion protein
MVQLLFLGDDAMTPQRPIMIAAAAVLLAVGGWIIYAQVAATRDLVMYGNIDIRQVDLAFMVDGKVAAVLVDEGAAVKQGDALARLDSAPYQFAADQAQGLADQAHANLAKAQAGSRTKEIDSTRAQLAEARARLANAQASFNRRQSLIADNAVSRQSLDDAARDVDVARATVSAREAALSLALEGFRSEEVDAARAAAKAADAALEQAKYRLAQTAITAPADGTILTRIREPGAMAGPSAPILTLALTTPVWVRTYVEGPRLGQIPPGAKVQVRTDARNGKIYAGTVGFVSPTAEFTPKAVETPELRTDLVYRVRIVVDNADQSLRQGMPVTVTLAK